METTKKIIASQRVNPALAIPANIISYILHPLFAPLILTYLIYKLNPLAFTSISDKTLAMHMINVAINTILFPLVTTLVLKGLGFIKSIKMEDPKDRIIPLIAVMIFYFWMYQVTQNAHYPFILNVLFLGAFWNIVAVFLISIFFKISMHTSAAGAVIGIMLVLLIQSSADMTIPLFASIVVAGIIGTARLILKAHKPAEVWLGYAVGLTLQIAAFYYLK